MNQIKITEVSLSEIDQLQEIGKKTFAETFSSDNSEKNLKKYLEMGFSREKLKTELADKNSQFFFAVLDKMVVGYLKINQGASQTEIKDDNALEIERIYVLKEYHGKDVAPALYQKALEIAKIKQVDYVWLGVWENNLRAIRFYKKNGFEEFDKHIFRLGNEEQTDIMMKLQLL